MTATGPAQATGMDPGFQSAIDAMIAASNGRLYIVSGYRSPEEQAVLYANAVKKYGPEGAGKWVAPPGRSNHGRGIAVDLGGDTALAHELAPRFGLVFPMSWEPWHVEPVHARDNAHPQAYTDPPPGQQNPVNDKSISTTPEYLAATLANSMRGVMDPTARGALDPTTGQPTDPSVVGTPLGGGITASTPAGAAPAAGAPATVGGEGAVDPAALYQALRGRGLSPAVAAAGVAIAGRESSYSPSAHNDNAGTGDNSYGLFQVNLIDGGWTDFLKAHGMENPAESLRTVSGSAEAFAMIYNNSGLNPWGGYKGAQWHDGTDMNAGVAASGGEVTIDELQGLK
jgi:hypothetical protein